eukprot:CAMPEP_0183309586 /NCGR_PEP_ID=MMETSP0160_2-20130417/25430_1 /TAXON_ID=2839 ORGANISM="Odontella Sinensis, Strain Grunow 1884" /NCGR_SAMPLE_ID=MMETSP0160_2 /ASSEMBLY_ACC=CAM_ASM_000250 /LENGTH=416 /DNA_ID=CAMNT_0025473639 /DNA_START=86 /DNA_END=1333 /DNA_ORIENTATION=-
MAKRSRPFATILATAVLTGSAEAFAPQRSATFTRSTLRGCGISTALNEVKSYESLESKFEEIKYANDGAGESIKAAERAMETVGDAVKEGIKKADNAQVVATLESSTKEGPGSTKAVESAADVVVSVASLSGFKSEEEVVEAVEKTKSTAGTAVKEIVLDTKVNLVKEIKDAEPVSQLAEVNDITSLDSKAANTKDLIKTLEASNESRFSDTSIDAVAPVLKPVTGEALDKVGAAKTAIDEVTRVVAMDTAKVTEPVGALSPADLGMVGLTEVSDKGATSAITDGKIDFAAVKSMELKADVAIAPIKASTMAVPVPASPVVAEAAATISKTPAPIAEAAKEVALSTQVMGEATAAVTAAGSTDVGSSVVKSTTFAVANVAETINTVIADSKAIGDPSDFPEVVAAFATFVTLFQLW